MDTEVDYDEEDTGRDSKRSQKMKVKGRGHNVRRDDHDHRSRHFETIEQSRSSGPAKSIEGYIVFVSGVHEEAQEDDILDKFSEYGDVKNIHVNLDRRTGFVKGYALVEFSKFDDAQDAITNMNGQEILGQQIAVDWAFVVQPN